MGNSVFSQSSDSESPADEVLGTDGPNMMDPAQSEVEGPDAEGYREVSPGVRARKAPEDVKKQRNAEGEKA